MPGVVVVAGVKFLDAIERSAAEREDRRHRARSAPPRQHSRRRSPRHGRGPENLLPRQVAGVVERSWIVEIARRPDARLDLDTLAVFQTLGRVVVVERQSHPNAGSRIEFQSELLAPGRKHRGFHHAAGQKHRLARPSVDLRARSRTMPGLGEHAHKEQGQRHAPAPQPRGIGHPAPRSRNTATGQAASKLEKVSARPSRMPETIAATGRISGSDMVGTASRQLR